MTTTTDRWERPIFFGLLIAHLAVVWCMPVFITQDGPSHLYNARIISGLWNGDPLYTAWFTLNSAFTPNWTGNLLLTALLRVFDPITAEKVLVSLYVAGLPLAFRSCTRAFTGRVDGAVLVFPFLFHHFLYKGFFNFCLGLPLLFFFIGRFQRLLAAPTWRLALTCTATLLLLALTHPVPLFVAFMAAPCLWLAFAHGQRNDMPALRGSVLRALGVVAPAALLYAMIRPPGDDRSGALFHTLQDEALTRFRTLDHLAVFHGHEEDLLALLGWLLLLGALATLVIALRHRRFAATHAAMATLFAGCAFIHFFVTDHLAGGDYLVARMALVAWLVFALLLTLPDKSRWVERALQLSVIGVATALIALRWAPQHRASQAALTHLRACERIPEGSTVLPLAFNYGGGHGIGVNGHPRFMLHVSGYACAVRRIISLDNYEANTDHFQTRWLPEVNPFEHLRSPRGGDMENDPLGIDIAAYEQRIGRRIPYLILSDVPTDTTDAQRYRALIERIEEVHVEVPIAEVRTPAGFIRLYHLR